MTNNEFRPHRQCFYVSGNFLGQPGPNGNLTNTHKKLSCPIGLLSYICILSTPKKYRTIITYKDYFEEFLRKQRQKVREKIIWTFLLIEEVPQVPDTYLKHLEGTEGLYEIRIQLASDIFRIFCFFDDGKLVVLANGFQKKTQKTPKQEIAKALKIKEEYYESKK